MASATIGVNMSTYLGTSALGQAQEGTYEKK
jgi:hypothetical protein